MEKEKTLVLIKPDGVERGLAGEVIKRLENRGLKIVAMKMIRPSADLMDKHYFDVGERHGEKIKKGMVDYMSSGPVVAMVVEGVDAINVVRSTVGSTYPNESPLGTIRGDFCHISKDYANSNGLVVKNLVHASAKPEEAEMELNLWFKPEEYIEYKRTGEEYIW
uniref:Nucleoside diphosphate kinase n=1 Tax=candidate division CPR3 bacterium TaxID=2268181 RepID=A0A7C4R5A4_UNCC3